MALSIIWDNEPEDRKEYITERLTAALGLTANMTQEEIIEELKSFIRQNPEQVKGGLANDMYNYLTGERKQSSMIEDIGERISKVEPIEEQIKKETFTFKQVKGKQYQKATKQVNAFVKGKTIKATPERYLSQGKFRIRYRDNKGRFVSVKK